ncbi:alpha-galactosidase [Akkermansia sp. N21116]|uniref:alpha-galactosidase n=1 Tax=Akkermansia sp. N21116 TaxID=3040764 RepID=UPI00244ED230|nr:alpha-galactosidase [Akkermansia sp. N21116]WPX40827.1 alpha-galactosidase [Akkermansia sp. N21116]
MKITFAPHSPLLISAALAGLCLNMDAVAEQMPFHLLSKDSQMTFTVNGNKVNRAYYGSRLAHPEDILHADSPSSTLLYPTRMDAMGPWENGSGELDISITQGDGTNSLDLVYDSLQVSKPTPGQELAIIRLKDSHYPVQVQVYVLANYDSNVFEQWVEITNNGQEAITIDQGATGHLHVKADKYFVTSFRGTWGGESLMREEEVQKGNCLTMISDVGARTAQEGTPGFVLSLGQPAREDDGEVYMGALAWSGNYKLSFKYSPYGRMFASFGTDMQDAPYRLEAGKSLTLPRLILTHSQQGKGEASRQIHRWARESGIRGGDQERMTLLNSWEGAYFNFDEPLLQTMMERAAGMGVELFVLDDGWFANKYPRNNDKAGLGDWKVNEKKLPNGLPGLTKSAKDRNIKFGLWVEMEMVNPKSELFEQHPDWVIQLPHRDKRLERNQLILDLSNPDVQQYIIDSMDDILSKNPEIVYIKWDCNRKIADPGSPYLSAANQKNLFIDYVNGYYKVLDAITKKHPEVIFQACASGGGRADYGAMKYHHEFWVSDNTDPYERVLMQWGIGHLFPAMAMASHVTVSPNHQTGRQTPLKFRFDVATTGRLGFELRPQDMNPQETEFAKKALETYKRIRPTVQLGDLYRLRSPYESNEASLMYVLNGKDGKQKAIVFACLMDKTLAYKTTPIKLKGLRADKRYRIHELNVDQSGNRTSLDNKELGGDYLMDNGVHFNFGKPLQSAILELEEI